MKIAKLYSLPALLVAFMLTLVGISAIPDAADAHQGAISVTSRNCVDGDTMKATFKLSWTSVPSNGGTVKWKTGTTNFDGTWNGSGGSNLTTITQAQTPTGSYSWDVTFTKSQFSGSNGPWVYAYITWTDGYGSQRNFDTRVEGFDWSKCSNTKDAAFTKSISQPTCASAAVLTYSGTSVTFSKASPITGPKTAAEATVTATPIAGHSWPDGTNGAKTVNNAALAGKLDPDLNDCAVKDATAAVTVTPPTCSAAGSAAVTGLANATLVAPLDQTPGAHTATFNANSGHRFADGTKTKTVNYTIASKIDANDDQCAAKNATASVTVTPPTCAANGAATVTGLLFATLQGTLDQTPGAHTATFNADSGHRFADGTKTKTVNYTIGSQIGADTDQCAVKDATAGVTVTDPTCASNGTASVTGLVNATLVAPLDQTPGAHTATFNANSGHRFADGTKTKTVNYTIGSQIGADTDQCAVKDATAGVSVTPATCSAAGSATYTVNHATLDGGVLPQTPGDHTATFTADSGHRFADGTKTKTANYTIAAQLVGQQCATRPDPYSEVEPQSESNCTLTGPNGEGPGGTNNWTITRYYQWEWNPNLGAHGEYEPILKSTVVSDKVFTAYSDSEFFDKCAPTQPPKSDRVEQKSNESCDLNEVGGVETWTITYTTTYAWNPTTRTWDGTEGAGVESKHTFVPYDDATYLEKCAPDQPKNGERTDPHQIESCTLNDVGGVQTWVTTYTTTFTWNPTTRTWDGVESEGVDSTPVFAAYTDAEFLAQCAPPQPDDKVVPGEWVDGLWGCGDTTVTQTKVTTTTPFLWDTETRTWVEDTANATEETTSQTRDLTQEEIESLDCDLTVGGAEAKCVSTVPMLAYSVDNPTARAMARRASGPLTITFVGEPDHTNVVYKNLPLTGKFLWPGASDGNPQMWPGWDYVNGKYVNVGDDNFGWTRDGVTVRFTIGDQSYTSTIDYPAESSLCANPTNDTNEPGTPDGPNQPGQPIGHNPTTGGSLPYTGAPGGVVWLGLGGLVFVLAGGVMVTAHRRRT